MSKLFDEFRIICLQLNKVGIIPTLMGSLGLEYLTKMDWQPSDIDIHVAGDPRGWEAPDEDRIHHWNEILEIMKNLGYKLVDLHEHEFQKNGLSVEFGSIDSLYEFAKIYESDIEIIAVDNIKFRLPNQKQFLNIYEASSKDSYRNDNNNNKDFLKIDFLRGHIKK